MLSESLTFENILQISNFSLKKIEMFKIYISNNFISFFLHLEHEEDAAVLHTTTYEQFLCKKMNLNKMIHFKYFSGFFPVSCGRRESVGFFQSKVKGVYI